MRRYVYGPGIDEPIVRIDVSGSSSARYYTHQDALGSVVAVTDNTGAVVEKDGYGVYGESASLTGNPYRFTGRRLDPETGLYYYRARYYSAYLGRFMQNDPIGYNGGDNLYAYIGNDPLNDVDPSGNCPMCAAAAAGAVLGVAGAYFSDPQHFTWESGLAGAAVGAAVGVTGVGLMDSFELGAGAQLTASTLAARASISVVTNAVSGFAGSATADVANNRPINWSQAMIAGTITGLAPLASGETAVTTALGGGYAMFDTYMAATTQFIADPLIYAFAGANNRPISNTTQDNFGSFPEFSIDGKGMFSRVGSDGGRS